MDPEKRGYLPVDVQEGRLRALPRREALDVARDQPVEERRAILPGDLDLPALGPVDHSHPLADRLVLGGHVPVVLRDQDSGSVGEARAEALVRVVKGHSLAHRSLTTAPRLYGPRASAAGRPPGPARVGSRWCGLCRAAGSI